MEDNVSRAVGENIRKLREDLGMSTDDLAKEMAVTQSTIYAYEKGNYQMPIGRAVYICELFGCSLAQLVGLEPLDAEEGSETSETARLSLELRQARRENVVLREKLRQIRIALQGECEEIRKIIVPTEGRKANE